MSSRIAKKINHLFHPIVGEVWCLHRVVEHRSRYSSNRELEITPQYLEEMILARKKAGYTFVPLDKLISTRPNRHRINISFDDGFSDLYTTAFPILLRHNVPFTLYLTTAMAEKSADLWWLQLEECGYSEEEFEDTMRQIYDNPAPMAQTMHQITKTTPQPERFRDVMLSWQQVNEMIDSGLCTIGSHTVNHHGLTRLSATECLAELTASRDAIKEHTGVLTPHFSYPHSMHNDSVADLLRRAGYTTATLGYGGKIRRGNNPYLLPRIYITQP